MTTTAKILVVLNLLLAVLFLGFSAASFSGRLGLQSSISKLEKEKKDAADKVAVERQSADKSDVESKKLSTDLNLKEKTYDAFKKQTDNTVENLTAENTGYRKQVDVTLQRIKQVTDESTQRKEEIDQARKQNQDLVTKNVAAQNELSKARDEIQDFKSQIERLSDKNRISEEKHRSLLNYLASVKFNLPPQTDWETAVESTPPPAVEGVVSEVRDGGKLMEITLGENDGLRSKHRLIIFRSNPAKYIGEVEVIRTWPNKAVVRLSESPLAPPKKGDRVAISPNLNHG